jgi:hypothetical protein
MLLWGGPHLLPLCLEEAQRIWPGGPEGQAGQGEDFLQPRPPTWLMDRLPYPSVG